MCFQTPSVLWVSRCVWEQCCSRRMCRTPIPTHTHTQTHRRVSPKCSAVLQRGIWRWEWGQGPLHRKLSLLGKSRFHRDLVPHPPQAPSNLAAGKAGLTTLWLALIAPPRLSQRTDCSQGQSGLSLQSPWPHPQYRRDAEATDCPFSLAGVHCCSSRTPVRLRCLAVPLFCWTKGHLHSIRISFDKMFFPREGQYAWALAAPQWLGLQLRLCALAACLLQPWCQDACSPTDSWAWSLKKPVRTLAATSPAAQCSLLLWEKLHLRDWQSSPEHAPVTCRKDLDYNSPAACAAQAFWPCANAVDFAYWSIFSSPRGLSYETVVQKLICAALVIVLLLLPCGYR